MNIKKLSEVLYTDQPSENAHVIVEDGGSLARTDIPSGGGVIPEIEAEIQNAQWKTVVETEIYNDTVTMPGIALIPNFEELPDTITVIYDGTEYTCPYITLTDLEGEVTYYGAAPDEIGGEYDWSEYPFSIVRTDDGDTVRTSITTETSGEHTFVIKSESVTYTPTFIEAVKSIAGGVEEVDTPDLADIAVITPNSDISFSYPLLLIDGSTGSISSETNGSTFTGGQMLILYRNFYQNREVFSNVFTTLTTRNNNLRWTTNTEVTCVANVWSITGSAALPTDNITIRWYSLGLPHADGGNVPQ